MFVGHVALALAAKKKAPELSLGWTVAAAITLDLLWPVFILLGIEQVAIGSATGGFDQLTFLSYPWSHSLVMSIVWAGAFYGLARWRGISNASALLLGALVVSHWVLDWVSHAPDMPLFPWGGPKVGLGLWGSVPATLAVEGCLYACAIGLYLSLTKAKDKVGSIGLWALLLLLLVAWASTPWSPAPPSVPAVIYPSIVFEWVMVAWAAWVDRHRATAAG